MSETIRNSRAGADILLTAGILAGFVLLVSFVGMNLLNLDRVYPLLATASFGFIAGIVWLIARRSSALEIFGAANRITLLRVALMVLVAATVSESLTPALSWSIVGVTTLALILDGFDGYLARRTNSSSNFGARFDMETDAAGIMILSILCWQFGKAGIWILAAGAMRYGFVIAARLLPWMRETLPYSRRRQTVCILQSSFLLGVISPVFPYPASAMLAAGTLVMLGTSFAIDIRWLWAQRHTLHDASTPTGEA